MENLVTIEERQRFAWLQSADREQHADEVKRMSRAELRHYVTYLRELQRLSIEQYESLFGRSRPAGHQVIAERELVDPR